MEGKVKKPGLMKSRIFCEVDAVYKLYDEIRAIKGQHGKKKVN